ncbi:hypothetical protein LINPERHAP2_LOCUS39526 [Linum perenne]
MATRRMAARVKEAEALTLRDVMIWMRDMGFGDVEFESDAQFVVDSVNREENDETEFGDIVQQCRSLLEENPSFVVSFGRSSNMMAHVLARHACSYDSPHCGVMPPTWLRNLLDECCLIGH